MEKKQYKRTTVTSALPYANGGVHIGHLAGVYSLNFPRTPARRIGVHRDATSIRHRQLLVHL